MQPLCGLLFSVLFLLAGFGGFSQTGFAAVPPPPGSSGYSIFGTQDQKGYMWFESLEVHRYDGYVYSSIYNWNKTKWNNRCKHLSSNIF